MSTSPNPSSVKAGKIAARVLKEIQSEIEPGVKLYRLCALAEKKIIEYGGRPAFPACISLNEVAAHYTSPPGDKIVIPDWGLTKVDVGVHVDGYPVDTALTLDIDGTLEGFIYATNDALDEALQMMTPGTSLGDVGAKIEKTIKSYGLRPLKGICGHDMKQNTPHGEKRVPNTKERGAGNIEAGEYYAIEPYATTGNKIDESHNVYVFENTGVDRKLEGINEKLRLHLWENYGPFPFALRWIGSKIKEINLIETIRELLKVKAIRGHPVLIEKSGRPVSQSEHTVFISEDGPILLTSVD